jgi:hypothetical protein
LTETALVQAVPTPKAYIHYSWAILTGQVRFAPLTRVWFFRTKLRVKIKKLGPLLFKQEKEADLGRQISVRNLDLTRKNARSCW